MHRHNTYYACPTWLKPNEFVVLQLNPGKPIPCAIILGHEACLWIPTSPINTFSWMTGFIYIVYPHPWREPVQTDSFKCVDRYPDILVLSISTHLPRLLTAEISRFFLPTSYFRQLPHLVSCTTSWGVTRYLWFRHQLPATSTCSSCCRQLASWGWV